MPVKYPPSPRLIALQKRQVCPYPPRSKRTTQLKDLNTLSNVDSSPSCGSPVKDSGLGPIVAGRIRSIGENPPTLSLEDATAVVSFEYVGSSDLGDAPLDALQVGDFVEGLVELGPEIHRLKSLTLLAPQLNALPANPGADLETLKKRAKLIHRIRNFFSGQGFLEVETPTLSHHPGLEPYLDPFCTHYAPYPGQSGQDVYLLTSPEYAMKGLIARGVERCFQLSRVYRNGELGPFHNPEFTMLEWYRAYASYLEIAQDLEDLILHLVAGDGQPQDRQWNGMAIDLTPPFERLTVRDAIKRHCNFDLKDALDAKSLIKACATVGLNLPDSCPWDEAFFQLLLDKVEPHLGVGKPTFLLDYPAPLAALARIRDEGDFPVAERFELYIAGVEIGNAFSELNNPDEQRLRFEEERAQRRQMGVPDFKPDPDYIRTLEAGIPPTGGIAVGVDRLVMVLSGAKNLRKTLVSPFPMG